jgi:hypothetical protein
MNKYERQCRGSCTFLVIPLVFEALHQKSVTRHREPEWHGQSRHQRVTR